MPNSWDRTADYLVDRRRLRRKVSFWRIGAFLALAIAVGAVGWRFAGPASVPAYQAHVARVTIAGVITGDAATLRMLDDLAKSEAQAVILSIESPGGTTTGAERLYESIRRVAEKKPTVAVVRGMAASGAYIAALGADRIVAQGNSLVGSIGVLMQFPNVSRLLDTLGVRLEEVKSSPLKAAPNGVEPTSPEARAALAALVTDSYEWFKGLVRQRRAMNEAELSVVADGRVFTGRQATALKLVDALGGEREAVAWLEAERNVRQNLPIRDWRPSRQNNPLSFLGVSAEIVEFAGFSSLSHVLRRLSEERDIQSLDGLLAIWQFVVVD